MHELLHNVVAYSSYCCRSSSDNKSSTEPDDGAPPAFPFRLCAALFFSCRFDVFVISYVTFMEFASEGVRKQFRSADASVACGHGFL